MVGNAATFIEIPLTKSGHILWNAESAIYFLSGRPGKTNVANFCYGIQQGSGMRGPKLL
jgi:hypothetical protein